MKTILVPTDFSEYALKASQLAATIANATGARIVFLHNVYSELFLGSSEQQKNSEALTREKSAKQSFEKLARNQMLKGLKTEILITHGAAYNEIIYTAKKLKTDVIIMGTHGNEEGDRFYIGSTTQKVLRLATCPVLTVKKDLQKRSLKKLVFAINLFDLKEKPIREILKLGRALDTAIHFLFVNRPTDFLTTREAHQKMDEFIKKYSYSNSQKFLYCHHSIEDGIMEYAEDVKADWIALVTQNRLSKPGYLIGNTETMVFRASIPVLSVNILPDPVP